MAQTKVKLISDGVIVQGNLHPSHGITTADIGEGSNLYYTDARVGSYLSTNSFATESYVGTQIANLVDSSPSALNTLNELAAALGDDANFSTTVTNSIALKAPLASPSFTGNATFAGNVTLSQPTNGAEAKLILTSKSAAGNSRTGIVEYDADTEKIFFINEGTTIAAMTSDGKVGIGTDSPNAKLKIEGNAATNGLSIKSAGNGGTFPFMVTWSGGTEGDTFCIDDNLNVGIGTTSPGYKLDVDNSVAGDWVGRFKNTSDTGYGLYIEGSSNDAQYLLGLNNGLAYKFIVTGAGNVGIGTTTLTNSSGYNTLSISGSSGGQIAFQTSGTGKHFIYSTATDLAFYNGQAGNLIFYTDGSNERMRIDSSGNVGIGTAGAPLAKLDVRDDIRVGASTSTTYDNNLPAHGGILIKSSGTQSRTAYIYQDDTTVSAGVGGLFIESSHGDTVINAGFASVSNILLNPSVAGNVGIGTTSPSQKLHVVGKSLFTDDIQLTQTSPRIDYGNTTVGSLRFFSVYENSVKMELYDGGRLYPTGGIFLGSSNNSNLLDDYEEGTWTPIASDFSGNNATIDATNSVGVYTKIGDLLYWRCTIQMSSKGSMVATDTFRVQGFPFTSISIAGNWYRPSSAIIKNVDFDGFVNFSWVANSTYGYMFDSRTGAAGTTIIVSDLSNNSAFSFSGVSKVQ